ncbi:MAG TPA: 4Fe-4S binding protein [Desulfomonilia bacterium]
MMKPWNSLITTKRLRKICQAAFLLVFLFLFVQTENKGSESMGYPIRLFLDFDPLLLITTMISSHAVPAALFLSLATIVLTLVFGRVFCGWICPLGTLNNAISTFSRSKKTGPGKLYRLKYYILFFIIAAAFSGIQLAGILDPLSLFARSITVNVYPFISSLFMSILDLIEKYAPEGAADISGRIYSSLRGTVLPFNEVHFSQSMLIGGIFFIVLLLNIVEKRFWCRYLCPLGALLGLLSRFAPFGIKVSEGCASCGACSKPCQGGAVIDNGRARMKTECLVCMDCDDPCPNEAVQYGIIMKNIPLDVKRRGVIFSLVAGIFTVPFFRQRPAVKDPSLIRPPGSVKESVFSNRCIKCGACLKVCPTGGLQPLLLEAGFQGIWTPRLVPLIGSCEYCTLCGQVCPTGAILEMKKDKLMNIKIGEAMIDRSRCLPWADGEPCIVCEEMCIVPQKAIWLEETKIKDMSGAEVSLLLPHVDTRRCIGCGKCEKNCPLDDRPAIFVTNTGESREEGLQGFL